MRSDLLGSMRRKLRKSPCPFGSRLDGDRGEMRPCVVAVLLFWCNVALDFEHELDMDDWWEDEDSSSADDDEVGADWYVDREAAADWYVDRAEIEADWYVEPSPHGGRIDLRVSVLAEDYRLSCRAADVAEVHEQVDQIRKRYEGHRKAEHNVAKAIRGLRARCAAALAQHGEVGNDSPGSLEGAFESYTVGEGAACRYGCGAFLFPGEPRGLCCRHGRKNLRLGDHF